MEQPQYDYIIIGSGLAGLQLVLAFAEDNFFANKKIALIDKSPKTKNDKTWCFWEKENGKWNNLVFKSWNTGYFTSDKKKIKLPLSPYSYKMIRSIDFYKHAKNLLKDKPFIHFIKDDITAVEENEGEVKICGKQQDYKAHHVFDSRIPKEYFVKKDNYTRIYQHFKGWMIETEKPQFNPQQFTMMDYRLKYKDSTSFAYILPISDTKAFVEYTFFTPFLVKENVYDQMLEKYISEFLNLKYYKITETEQGIIPMTDFPFYNYHTSKITKIGTAGGWVKGSTGYSFKHTEKKVAQILQNIKEEKKLSTNLFSKKFKYYDKIFLNVLAEENEKGEWIFEQFYDKNTIQDIFSYLDEETHFVQDLKIMGSLFSSAFIKAFFRSF